MRYVIDVTQKQVDYISRLVNLGRYSSTAQFILTAMENQLYIEEGDEVTKLPTNKLANGNSTIHIKEYTNNPTDYPGIDVDVVPSLTDIRSNKVKTMSYPRFEDLACSIKRGKTLNESDAWLWGQVNRIFPIKLGLRILLASLGKEETVELESFRTKAGEIALAYGKMLRGHERHEKKIRVERVSAGLPIDISDNEYRELTIAKLGKNTRVGEIDAYLQQEEFKSTNRYRAQFLASMRKDGKLEGAMPYLRFVSLKKHEDGKVYIGVTNAGLDFACLKNPIIDDKNFDASLADKEKEYYLEHVYKNVKGEHAAIQWLLKKIESGINRREQINDRLKAELNPKWEDSDLVINTQRAGLMARMFELGLIGRDKEGVSVEYKVTTNGMQLITKKGR
ncbi:MAG: hypothetical protein COW92_01665 [Candidatus Omnitrophica bacterium CG22_combo_CG10-13_8_21_14_all_43_16]|nr:MAG: hypothetical protein COW92_01665 [Candidatus Omnitrophica bacterium CG22_combo_CG10-13_8_21_14_all_43_16]